MNINLFQTSYLEDRADSMDDYDPIETAVDKWTSETQIEEYRDKISDYHNYIHFKWLFVIGSVLLAIICSIYALSIGADYVTFTDAMEVVWNHLTGNPGDMATNKDEYAVWFIRRPSVCCGLLAGAGLAAAGAVMQSILRNPLADPYTTGISSGASFGASLAMGFGLSVASTAYAVVANAFIFALIPMAVIILVSKIKSASPTTMIMAGIAVMYIFNAATTLIKLFVDPESLSAIYAWSVGSIDIAGKGIAGWDAVTAMFFFVVIGTTALILLSRKLNVVATGDESSKALGVNSDQMRIISLLIVSFLAAGVVSFTGLIGFIGLVCPHIARIFVGSDNRYLIPASAAFGAALLIISDIIGKSIFYPTTVQVGVITAFIGGPLFLYLIVRQKKEAW
ncbi:iron ABC transporter permease protein [methanogenic archaeon mixed culture ISO4-G1]|nr:iron ABC transporter permease protein [methanogenic archaeon mixed culture ISO4-G1]